MHDVSRNDSVRLPESIESNHRSNGDTKRYRPKRHLAWEQAELASHGLYGENLHRIAERYPMLTPMELRVAALIKAQLPSWRIAEILAIREETVDNHRSSMRKKIGLETGSLQSHLSTL
jgi:DNA-binding CsgD family transcriptional regulator